MFILANELSAISGGIILIIMLLIVTALVFAVKFALDIALAKRLSVHEKPQEKNFVYAVQNQTPRKKRTPSKAAKYTIIPENKLFILENPSNREKRF